MPADQETGLSFLFDTAFKFQPDFNRYVSNYVQLLKFDNPYMDETQMSMAQQTLKVEFYRLCLESLGLASFDGLLILDYNGILLEINAMAEKTLGVKRTNVLGDPFFDKLFPGTQKDEYLAWIQKNAKNTGEVFRKSTEVLMVKSSGTMFPAEIKVTELKIFGSALLVVCFNDITRRKWMDQALKYTEERYRKIMGENADAICLIDPYNKRIEESNPAFNILLGYSDDELFALRLYDLLDSEPEAIDDWVDKLMRSGTRLLIREHGRFFTRNRIPVDVEYSCSIFDLRDHPLLCFIVRDTAPREYVVRRSLSDNQIDNLQSRLDKLKERLRELEQTKLDKVQTEILTELYDHHQALAKEIEREAGDDEGPLPKRQNRQPFVLKTVLFHVQNLFKELLENKQLPLNISVEPDVPDVLIGDPLKLQEILYHLLENAIEHTPEGDLLIQVRVTQHEYSTMTLLFALRDAGGGVPAVTKAKISDVFSSDKPLETGEKFGIRGLTLCAYYVKALNGRIWFNTLEGKGSSFLFSVPLETTEQEAEDLPELTQETIRQHLQVVGGQIYELKTAEPASQADAAPAEAAPDQPGFSMVGAPTDSAPQAAAKPLKRPLTLLLVEQDIDNMIALQSALAGRPVEMRTVDNGRKALEMVQERAFDLILMALELPIMDGYAATAAIRDWERESRPNKETLIVALCPEGSDAPAEDILQDFDLTAPKQLDTEVVGEVLSWAQDKLGIASQPAQAHQEPEDLFADFASPAAAAPQAAPPVQEPQPETQPEPQPTPAPADAAEPGDRYPVTLTPDMARLAPDFLNKRRQDVQKIHQALSDGKLDSIRVIGKSMKGTGGVYGFSQIAEIGKELEAAASSQSLEAAQTCLARLEDFLDKVDIIVA